jgi:hypothetical protein
MRSLLSPEALWLLANIKTSATFKSIFFMFPEYLVSKRNAGRFP